MSARRMLITSLLISLLGHLVIFTTFSVATFKEGEKPDEVVQVSFLGEFVGAESSPRVATVVEEGKMPQLQPALRELETGPGLSLSKPRPVVPVPQISPEGIISLLRDEETSLLEVKVSDEEKKSFPKRLHLLEKERKE